MEEGSKKLFLKIYKKKFTEEKITADIVCNLCIADFQKTGTTDRNAIASPRIAFSKYGSCIPRKNSGTNKFAIPKMLLENVIDDGFSVKKYPKLYVPKQAIFRRIHCTKNEVFH